MGFFDELEAAEAESNRHMAIVEQYGGAPLSQLDLSEDAQAALESMRFVLDTIGRVALADETMTAFYWSGKANDQNRAALLVARLSPTLPDSGDGLTIAGALWSPATVNKSVFTSMNDGEIVLRETARRVQTEDVEEAIRELEVLYPPKQRPHYQFNQRVKRAQARADSSSPS